MDLSGPESEGQFSKTGPVVVLALMDMPEVAGGNLQQTTAAQNRKDADVI